MAAPVFIETEVITVRGADLTLDTLCWRRFRSYLPGYVERVLDLNRGLAGRGAIIPPGTVVVLPAPLRAERSGEIEVIKLWG